MYVGYPSSDFPGPPGVILPLPEGWEGLHIPDVALAIRGPNAEGFAANVVVRIHKHVDHSSEELFELLTEPTKSIELSRTEMFGHTPPGIYRKLPGRAGEQDIEQQHLLVIPYSEPEAIRYAVSIVGSSRVDDPVQGETVAEILRG